jgi:hypothetical protein
MYNIFGLAVAIRVTKDLDKLSALKVSSGKIADWIIHAGHKAQQKE